MVDNWFDRSMFFLSYGFTERKCTGHSSRHSMHDCANSGSSISGQLILFTLAITRKKSSHVGL